MHTRLISLLLACSSYLLAALACHAHEPFTLRRGEVVAFLGGTNTVNMLNDGTLEALLTIANADKRPKFVDLSWEGDTVYRQGTVIDRWRKNKFGNLSKQLSDLDVTCVVVQFGQNEALDGLKRKDEFAEALERLLAVCRESDRKVVVLTPVPFNPPINPLLPDLSKRNDGLAEYVTMMRDMSNHLGCRLVNLFEHFSTFNFPPPRYHERNDRLTHNGLHIAPGKHAEVARTIAVYLGISRPDDRVLAPVRELVAEKHRLWMSYWRPPNWKCLYGDDGKREFGKATAGGLTLREEWMQLPDLIAAAEKNIWQLAAGRMGEK